ncbi:MAG: hypothetical protein MHPSP_004596, partial [Paramarteilia canceri]
LYENQYELNSAEPNIKNLIAETTNLASRFQSESGNNFELEKKCLEILFLHYDIMISKSKLISYDYMPLIGAVLNKTEKPYCNKIAFELMIRLHENDPNIINKDFITLFLQCLHYFLISVTIFFNKAQISKIIRQNIDKFNFVSEFRLQITAIINEAKVFGYIDDQNLKLLIFLISSLRDYPAENQLKI